MKSTKSSLDESCSNICKPSLFKNFFRPRKRSRRKYPWWAWSLLVLLAPVAIWGPDKLLITTSASLPYRIWWKTTVPSQSQILPGQYYAFRRVHPWTDKKTETLMVKRISCFSGQNLEISGLNYYCDDRWLGAALKKDFKGNMLDRFQTGGLIPPHKYFMSCDHPHSWDSKYYGFVDSEEFKYRVLPIF